MRSSIPSSGDVLAAVEGLGPAGTPVTTAEVADAFDCTNRTVYNRLDSLVEAGDLETKKVGARGRVWWRPVGGRRPEGTPPGARGERSRAPIEATDQGYCVVEVLFGANDDPVDYRFLETDPGFGDRTGLVDATDKRMRELAPDRKDPWVERYGRVATTGQPERFTNASGHPDGRLYDVYAFRIGRPEERRVAVFATDVTERNRAEAELARRAELDAFRVELTDALRPLVDPVEIQREAARVLVERLDVRRALSAEVLPDGNTVRVHADHSGDGLRSTVGEHRLDDYGEFVAETLRSGEPLVIDDVAAVPELDEADRTAYPAAGIEAYLAVPLVKDGRLVGYVTLDRTTRREWTDAEIAVVEETVERTWAAVERARAEQALRESEERYRTLFESIDEGFFLIEVLFDDDGDPVDYRFVETNPAYEKLTGQVDVEGKTRREIPPEADEGWIERYGRIARTGVPERFTAQASRLGRWFDAYAFRTEASADPRVAVVFSDVTDRRRTQVALERLNAASRELIDADTETVTNRIADLTQAVLGVEYASLWRYDELAGRIEEDSRAAAAGTDPDSVRLPESFPDRIWETFVGDETDVDNDVGVAGESEAASAVRSRALVPLGRHGVICAASTQPGTFDERSVDLLETVAGTVATAWDRAESERELAERNEELRGLDRLNRLIRRVDQALVAAESREEIERTVCERLADSERFAFAWVGERDPIPETVEPTAWAGVDGGYLDDVAAVDAPAEDDPVARADRTGELQVVHDVATDGAFAPWRAATLDRGARSCVSIPLVYGASSYGVLTVYATRPQADERDLNVLAELGGTVAHAIDAVETRATLQTDRVVELTLGVDEADAPLRRFARRTGADIEFDGFVPRRTGDTDVFFTAAGDGAAIERAAEASRSVVELQRINGQPDSPRFRARLSDATLAERLVDQGAVIRSVAADGESMTAVVDLPHNAEVRRFVDGLRRRFPQTELFARRTVERPIKNRRTYVAAVGERLTGRQWEALQTAYLSGFFESPRASTGQDVAALLDVSQPTLSQHLRAAERSLCGLLFDEQDASHEPESDTNY